jgi:hypothetical protein
LGRAFIDDVAGDGELETLRERRQAKQNEKVIKISAHREIAKLRNDPEKELTPIPTAA